MRKTTATCVSLYFSWSISAKTVSAARETCGLMAGKSINKDITMKSDMCTQASTCTDFARNFTAAHVTSCAVTRLDAVVRRQKFWTEAVAL